MEIYCDAFPRDEANYLASSCNNFTICIISSLLTVMFTEGDVRILLNAFPLSNHSFHGLKKSSKTDGNEFPADDLTTALFDIITSFVLRDNYNAK